MGKLKAFIGTTLVIGFLVWFAFTRPDTAGNVLNSMVDLGGQFVVQMGIFFDHLLK